MAVNQFKHIVTKIFNAREKSEREAREFAEFVFEVWRERYLITLAESIRLDYALRSRGLDSSLDADWSNCAALILEFCSLDVQDMFLRSTPQQKNRLVQAVFDDGGLYDEKDRWVGLPVL